MYWVAFPFRNETYDSVGAGSYNGFYFSKPKEFIVQIEVEVPDAYNFDEDVQEKYDIPQGYAHCSIKKDGNIVKGEWKHLFRYKCYKPEEKTELNSLLGKLGEHQKKRLKIQMGS